MTVWLGRDSLAGVLLLLAVALYAFTPVLAAWVDGASSPFLFAAAGRGGVAVGFGAFLLLRWRRVCFSPAAWRVILKSARNWRLLLVMVGFLDIGLMVWSFRYVDPAIAVVAAEVSPILLVLVIARSRERSGGAAAGQRGVSRESWGWMLLALLGFVLVAASREGRLFSLFSDLGWVGCLGVVVALGSALLSAFNGFCFRWGRDLARELASVPGTGVSAEDLSGRGGLDLFGATLAGFLANLAAAPVNAVVGVVLAEEFSWGGGMLVCAVGATAFAAGGLLFRQANIVAANPGVNAVAYLRPALSLVWLGVFGMVAVASLAYLSVGTGLVVLANGLIFWRGRRG